MWSFMALAAFLQILQLLQILDLPFTSIYEVELLRLNWPESQAACMRKDSTLALLNNETAEAVLDALRHTDFSTIAPDMLTFWVGNSQPDCTPPTVDDLVIRPTSTTESVSSSTTSMTGDTPETLLGQNVNSNEATSITDATESTGVEETTVITTTTAKPICQLCDFVELVEDEDAEVVKNKKGRVIKQYKVISNLAKCDLQMFSICQVLYK